MSELDEAARQGVRSPRNPFFSLVSVGVPLVGTLQVFGSDLRTWGLLAGVALGLQVLATRCIYEFEISEGTVRVRCGAFGWLRRKVAGRVFLELQPSGVRLRCHDQRVGICRVLDYRNDPFSNFDKIDADLSDLGFGPEQRWVA